MKRRFFQRRSRRRFPRSRGRCWIKGFSGSPPPAASLGSVVVGEKSGASYTSTIPFSAAPEASVEEEEEDAVLIGPLGGGGGL